MISAPVREEFKQLYFRKYNIHLSNEEATEMATDLLNLVKTITKPKSFTSSINQERSENEAIRTQQLQYTE